MVLASSSGNCQSVARFRSRIVIDPSTKEYQRPVELPRADDRPVSEVTVSGSLAKRFQAVQQASGIASQLSRALMAGQGNRLKGIGWPL